MQIFKGKRKTLITEYSEIEAVDHNHAEFLAESNYVAYEARTREHKTSHKIEYIGEVDENT